MIVSIILLPNMNACYHQNVTSAIVEVDCTKISHVPKAIPGTPNISISSSHCKDYQFNLRSIKLALDIFVQEYSSSFDITEDEAWLLLSGLHIEVSAIPRTVKAAYTVDGKLLEGDVPVSGLALNKNLIWVEIKTSQIWSSALVHELIHTIIWRKNIVHADPDHEGKEFSGWTKKHTELIKRINKILLDAEI
tara:strand:- start:16664 stop:17239 length:576 start_codon:yes stop_codon:yes gene_type:complete